MKTLTQTIKLTLITLALESLYSPAVHAKRYTLDQVAIDTTTGIAKGLSTDLAYDAKAKVLYRNGDVIQKNVSFIDLLQDCTTIIPGQDACIDPISGAAGYLDRSTSVFISAAWYLAQYDAYQVAEKVGPSSC